MIPAVIRVLLRFELRRAGRSVTTPFDRKASRRIDALRTALEIVGED